MLHKSLGIKNIEDLEGAARSQRIRGLEGMGEKTETDILANIEFVKKSSERQLLGTVLPFANHIVEELKKSKAAKTITVAGSLRRMKETIGDVDILAISSKPDLLIRAFTQLSQIDKIIAKGETKCSARMKNGLQVDIRILEEKSFGSALNYFTGSKEHNIELRRIAITKKLKLSEYGLFGANDKMVAGRTEEELYAKLGMRYVEPELRENRGEIEASQQGKLPRIIGYKDIKGDLQVHSTWSDGLATIEEMAKQAAAMGYEYIGITDHGGSLRVANSLDEKRIDEQRKEIDALNRKLGIRIFHGLEVNIREDGNLDVANSVLKKVDFVVASVHSGFKNSREKMTNRVCKAMENPYVTYIAHPTGRIINARQQYEIEIDRVLDKAVETGTMLEINAHPSRLDLNDINSRVAIRRGCRLIINTDAHAQDNMRDMMFGIATARRGWCEAKDILNTLSLKKFERIFLN